MNFVKSKSTKKYLFLFSMIAAVIFVGVGLGLSLSKPNEVYADNAPAYENATFDASKIMIDRTELTYNKTSQTYPVSYDEENVNVTVTYSLNNDFFTTIDNLGTVYANTYTVYYKLSAEGYTDYVSNYEMTIKKAQVPQFNAGAITLPKGATKLSDVPLPDNWAWVYPEMKLSQGTVQVEATYIGEDSENYERTSVNVLLTISSQTKSNNPWMLVVYIMIPVNVVMTIVYILYMRKRRFKKKYIENGEV